MNISFGSTRAYTAGVLAAAASYEELYGSNGDPFREPVLGRVSD
jgi:hypothetical protein